MEEINKMEVTEESRKENDEQRNGGDGQDVGSTEKENVRNGGGDNGDHFGSKVKSKVSFDSF